MSRYRINRTISGAAAATDKDRAKMRVHVMRWFVEDWHENLRPLHFTNEGARRYSYGRRHTKEVRTGQVKRDKKGRALAPTGRPLVWSGTSEQLAKIANFTAKETSSKVTMPVRAFNWKPPGNPTLNMRWEFTQVPKSELGVQEKQASVRLERMVRRFNRSITRRHTG